MSGQETDQETEQVAFGATTLGEEQLDAFRTARRLQWISLPMIAVTVTIIMLVMGSSQAMKPAWIEDLLSFLPPIAFLVAGRVARKAPGHQHPWGYHRAVGIGHLAAALALLALGSFVVYDAAMTLISREHPTIGTIDLFGHTVWQGWLMMAGLVVTAIPTMIMGRLKMKAAKPLHDKILYADADMMRADWTTATGAVIGLILIGFGMWWADAAVAALIGADIVKDGVVNVRNATRGLMDATVRTYDDKNEHPLLHQVEEAAAAEPGVAAARVRMRDMGHLFHTEVFIIPSLELSPAALAQMRERLASLDWKLEDMSIVPVPELPDC